MIKMSIGAQIGLKNSRNELSDTKFPDYNSYPTSAKNALLDMQYNMGENFQDVARYNEEGNKLSGGWPKLFEAVRNENWERASEQSTRPQLNNINTGMESPRNIFVREEFKNATK